MKFARTLVVSGVVHAFRRVRKALRVRKLKARSWPVLPFVLLLAGVVIPIFAVRLSSRAVDDELVASQKASTVAAYSARALEGLMARHIREARSLASAVETTPGDGATLGENSLRNTLDARSAVTVFGEGDCDNNPHATDGVPCVRREVRRVLLYRDGVLLSLSGDPDPPPGLEESWLRALVKTNPETIVISRLYGRWIDEEASGLRVEGDNDVWYDLRGAPPLVTAKKPVRVFKGVYRLGLSVPKHPRFAVAIDLDHAHVAELVNVYLDRNDNRQAPESARGWFEKYYEGRYTYLIDDRSWIVAHPKPWHIVGLRENDTWTDAVEHKDHVGTRPLKLSEAKVPDLRDYYDKVVRHVLAKRLPAFVRGGNLDKVNRVVWAEPVMLDEKFVWADADPNNPLHQNPNAAGLPTDQKTLFGVVIAGVPVERGARLYRLARHVPGMSEYLGSVGAVAPLILATGGFLIVAFLMLLTRGITRRRAADHDREAVRRAAEYLHKRLHLSTADVTAFADVVAEALGIYESPLRNWRSRLLGRIRRIAGTRWRRSRFVLFLRPLHEASAGKIVYVVAKDAGDNAVVSPSVLEDLGGRQDLRNARLEFGVTDGDMDEDELVATRGPVFRMRSRVTDGKPNTPQVLALSLEAMPELRTHRVKTWRLGEGDYPAFVLLELEGSLFSPTGALMPLVLEVLASAGRARKAYEKDYERLAGPVARLELSLLAGQGVPGVDAIAKAAMREIRSATAELAERAQDAGVSGPTASEEG